MRDDQRLAKGLLISIVLTVATTACGAGYDCHAARRAINQQEQLVVPLMADLIQDGSGSNDCDSGGGGYWYGTTKPGVSIADVAARLTARGWTSRPDKQGNKGALVLTGEVSGHPFEVFLDHRPPKDPVVQVSINSR